VSGINLAGHLSAPQGLGVAARNTTRLLDELGVPWMGIDIPVPAATAERVAWASRQAGDPLARATHDVNLLHLNPPEALELLWQRPRWLVLERRATACVPFWEFPKLPRSWLDGLACMDAVLAPSRFVERSVRAALPELPVYHFPQAVWLDSATRADRARFALPPEACVFVTVFDTRSDLARKNPLGVLDAFARAFPAARRDVRLALRIQNARGGLATVGVPALRVGRAEATLRERAARDARVVIFDAALTHADVLALIASCDVYVSLHRAEGFGLVPLEAMSLGRPVVATAWSGTLDYMTADNSLLVPATETPVLGTAIRAYDTARMGEAQTWGEPDLDVAASHLRALADEPALRTRLGERALAAAARQRQASLAGDGLAQFAELAARRVAGEPVPPACAAARARVARQGPARRVRRRFVDLLRAVGVGPRA